MNEFQWLIGGQGLALKKSTRICNVVIRTLGNYDIRTYIESLHGIAYMYIFDFKQFTRVCSAVPVE